MYKRHLLRLRSWRASNHRLVGRGLRFFPLLFRSIPNFEVGSAAHKKSPPFDPAQGRLQPNEGLHGGTLENPHPAKGWRNGAPDPCRKSLVDLRPDSTGRLRENSLQWEEEQIPRGSSRSG
jgi:hypothetical protein